MLKKSFNFYCYGVNDTAVHIREVLIIPLCISQWCQWHHFATSLVEYLRIWFETLFFFLMRKSDSAAHSTAVSLALLWLAQRCQWHHCDMQSSVNDTAVQKWHRCDFDTNIRRLCQRLYIKKNIDRQIVLHYFYNFDTQNMVANKGSHFWYSSVIDTTVNKIGNFIVDFLRKFETIFIKALTRVPGA
jgi:hypothetical protein